MERQPLYAMGLVFLTAVAQGKPGAWTGLTAILPECAPGELSTSVKPCNPLGYPNLFMKFGNLGSIPTDAFITYTNLRALTFQSTGIGYIAEGAFNGLDKLVSFISISNLNLQLPSDFGPPTKTLTTLMLYDSLPKYKTPVFPYFAAFENLKLLDIGGSWASYGIENLPPNLTIINLGKTHPKIFPDLGKTCAMLQEIYIPMNDLHSISLEAVTGLNEVMTLDLRDNNLTTIPDISFMSKLKILRLHNNHLSSVPDLYDLPLTTLTLQDNPLICDKALCWIRMLPWTKPNSPISTNTYVCAGPPKVSGMELMKVDPAFMGCFGGKWRY